MHLFRLSDSGELVNTFPVRAYAPNAYNYLLVRQLPQKEIWVLHYFSYGVPEQSPGETYEFYDRHGALISSKAFHEESSGQSLEPSSPQAITAARQIDAWDGAS